MTPTSRFRSCIQAHALLARCLTLLYLLTCGAMVAQAQHDCVPYDPTTANESVNSTWLTPTEMDTYQIVVPDDPGGGYVIASITSDVPAEPRMNIYPPLGPTAPIARNNTNTNGPSPFTLTVAFEVAGGETYNVELLEDVQAPLANHPIDYQWSWTFVSKPDCYEPNDSSANWAQIAATARQIPLDQLLEAYGISGHLTFSIPSDADHSYDWYKFTLSQQMQIWFGSMQVPSDQRITFRLYDDAGFLIVEDPPPPVGGTTVVGPSLLSAGTYYLEVHPAPSGENDAALSEGEPLPDHFEVPYRFVVTTEAITTCGFMAIYCDGFEFGDTTAWSATEPPIPLLPNAADLLWYYSADVPGTGDYPIDLGPLALGTMTHVGSKPGLSVSAGPNGHSAWGPFVSSGFFKNAGTSTTYATGDYTVAVMFQKQPYDVGFLPYILGYDDVADESSASRLEGGHFTNGGGSDSQTFTWSGNTPTACDSGGPASPDMNWYIFGAYKAPGSQSIVSTFLTTVGSLTDIATGELQAGTIGPIGDEVRLGGQHDLFWLQGMRGYIWKAMAWTGQPSRFDIYAWAKVQAGL